MCVLPKAVWLRADTSSRLGQEVPVSQGTEWILVPAQKE